MPTGEKSSYSIKEKNFLDLDKANLSPEDQATIENIVKLMPVKVEVELILPDGTPTKDVPSAVKPVVERYISLIAKQSSVSFKAVAEGFRNDQAGMKEGYSSAESALDKLNKYVEKLMEGFRVDLREAVAKKLGLKSKALMTVGRVSTKESTLIPGVFAGETVIDNNDDGDDGDLGMALKYKRWQYVGLASSTEIAKLIANRKKEITKSELKEMAELFDDKDRPGLKFSRGKMKATSETCLQFEFLDKTKVGKDPRTFTTRLKKGLKLQVNKNVHLEIKPVKKYSEDT